ncbi:MAG: methyltransferase domain-containing protein [Actinomycetes bacterium]
MINVPQVATLEDLERAWEDPRLANVLYHDWEASTYDEKWSISYDDRCISYARDRFVKIAGEDGWPYRDALEVGCGTGFFLLNLKQAGVLTNGAVTDISPGMVEVAQRNARGLGFEVDGRVADAERIPYPDNSFDLVIGHAVLHHIPDVEQALRECLRVLRPGGRFVFCGEPTTHGDFVARRLSQATWWATTKIGLLPGVGDRFARPKRQLEQSSRIALLEAVVDIHTFAPKDLRRTAIRAGAVDVETVTEELTASWLGWPIRTFEAAVKPGVLGWTWAMFAYHSWMKLSALDEAVMSRFVPEGLFYNVCITGVKQG